MLNRLFILVGLIAILALAAAFVAPGLIRWEDYRDRMQAIASETFGAPVRIDGDIDFALLPEPQLQFSDVTVGTPEAPVMTVARVEARFSLVDFFRDHYTLNRLELTQPVIDVRLDADGRTVTGLALTERVANSDVSVPNARIVGGTVRLTDARTGATQEATGVDGDLRIEAVSGPFGFQGHGVVGGAGYALRLAMGAASDEGPTTLSVYMQPDDQRFTLSMEGNLTTGDTPSFSGTASYRQPPVRPAGDQPVDVGRGDFVVEGKLDVTPDRLLLRDYTVTPDQNRAATRLTGAAEVKLGADPSFNAVISGTSLALPPRDATVETGVSPYELVRLLNEIGLPPLPPIPGKVGIDITEADMRAVTVRNLRIDAEVANGAWRIDQLSAVLPGNSRLKLSGTLRQLAGRPNFSGAMTLSSERLDALAQLWRRPDKDNVLFGVSGAYAANVALVGETLSLSDGRLTLDGGEHAVSAEIGFGATSRHLNVEAQFGVLSSDQSRALGALLPDTAQSGAFALTFPKGSFDVRLPSVTLLGLAGTNLKALGSWEGGVVAIDTLSADDLGGASLDARLTAFGSVDRPEISGSIELTVLSAGAPALTTFYDALQAPPAVRSYLAQWLPAQLELRLDAPSGEGGQEISLTGRSGSTDLRLDARVAGGFLRALDGPLSLNLDLASDDAESMSRQLGLGDISLTPDDQPMHAVAIVEGTPTNSVEATLLVEGGTDSIGFSGNLVVSNPSRITGDGTVKATLTDAAALTTALGAGGLDLPQMTGSAHLSFDGTQSLSVDQIAATSGGQQFSGRLALTDSAGQRSITGALDIGRFSPSGLLSLFGGRQALLSLTDATWPDGPLTTGDAARATTGRVSITAPALVAGDRELATSVAFDLDWDATTTRLRRFTGSIGEGTVTLDAAICCAGPIAARQLNGRLNLAGVPIDAVAPDAIASGLDGTLDASAQFDGTGTDFASLLGAMTGQGSYAVQGLRIEGLSPDAFARAATMTDVLDTDALVLTAGLVDQLDDAALAADPVQGSFTIAGGVLRSPNLPITGDGLRLFGTVSVALASLALNGGFAMTPTAPPTGDLLSEAMAQISVNLSGTLLAPIRTFDAAGMVEAMKAQALEAEVERLEALRAEDEARQKAAAEERARIAAEQAEKEAAAAAERRAAEEAAARQRAEAERRRQEQQPAPQEQQTDIVGPLDLGL